MNKEKFKRLFKDRDGLLEEYVKSNLPDLYYKVKIKK